MALNVGELFAKISLDLRDFNQSISQVKSSMMGVSNRVQSMESDMRDAMSGASRATDKLSSDMGNLESSIQSAGAEADKQGKTMQERFDEVAQSTEELSIAIGALVGSAMLLGGLGVKASDDMDDALKRLQFQTGSTNTELEKQAEILKSIYGQNVGESYEDVANSMSKFGTATGLTGAELESATVKALQMSKYMGYDLEKSTWAVSRMMIEFGVSADDAFNMIAQATQKGANYADDLLDTVSEYSVHYKSAGMSAEDMFNSLIAGAKGGSWNLDKVADSLKENVIRLGDGSKASRDALTAIGYDFNIVEETMATGGASARETVKSIAQALLDMKDKSQQSQLAVSLFGTQFEDIKKVALTSLVDVKDEIDMTKNAFDALNNPDTKTFGSAMEELWRLIQTNVLAPIGDTLKPVLFDIINFFKENMTEIQAFVGGLGSVIEMVVGGLWTFAKPVFMAISGAIAFTNKHLVWLIPSLKAIATMLSVVAIGIGAYTIAVNVARMATLLWNAVMAMNPIFLIGMAIAGAVIALGELTDWFGMAGSEAESAGNDIDSAMLDAQSSVDELNASIDDTFQDRDMTVSVDGEMTDVDLTDVTPTDISSIGKMKYVDTSEAMVAWQDENGKNVMIPMSQWQKKYGKKEPIIIKDEPKKKEESKPPKQKVNPSVVGGKPTKDANAGKTREQLTEEFMTGKPSTPTKSGGSKPKTPAPPPKKISDSEVQSLKGWLKEVETQLKKQEADRVKKREAEEKRKRDAEKARKAMENTKTSASGASSGSSSQKQEDSAQKKQFDATMKYIRMETEARRMSIEKQYSLYKLAQSRLNLTNAEGRRLWDEAEKEKYRLAVEISNKLVANAEKTTARMAKLSSDPERVEITRLEQLLKDTKLSADDRLEIEESLWDKKVNYATKASQKILDQTLKDIDKAKDAELKRIERVYGIEMQKVEDLFAEKEKAEGREDREKKLNTLRQRESILANAVSKEGIERLKEVREQIEAIMDEERKIAQDSLKKSMLDALEKQKEEAIEKAEAKAEALAKDAETKAKSIETTLVDVASKAGSTMQSLVDKIASYSGTMYKAGADVITQFGLGLDKFTPKLQSFASIIKDISNASSLKTIDSLLKTGTDSVGKFIDTKLQNPITSVTTNNKTVSINAPLINIASVNIKDKTDAVAFAKEQQRLLEIAQRSIGK